MPAACEPGPVAVEPRPAAPQAGTAGDEADPAVPEPGEVLGGADAARPVRGADRRHVEVGHAGRVDDDGRHVQAPQLGVQVGVERGGHQDDAVAGAGPQVLQPLAR
jgi:hypothetical protein